MFEQTSGCVVFFFFWSNYSFLIYFNAIILLKYINIYNYYKYI